MFILLISEGGVGYGDECIVFFKFFFSDSTDLDLSSFPLVSLKERVQL